MLPFRKDLAALWVVIPTLILLTFVNAFIEFSVAGVVFFILIGDGHGMNRDVALAIALVMAVLTHCWIVSNHRIKNILNVNKR